VKRTVEPGRVKTLTSTTETAIGRLSRRLAAQEARESHPPHARRAAWPTLIAIGPTYPPNTNAPIEPTVAMTALV
jgi:hypothetical protein